MKLKNIQELVKGIRKSGDSEFILKFIDEYDTLESEIIGLVKYSNFDIYACKLALNKNKSKEERIREIRLLKLYNYHYLAGEILINKKIDKYRTLNEKVVIIDKLKESNFNEYMFKLETDENLLKMPWNDQVKLIEAFEKCEYNENAFSIGVYKIIIENRTVDEQVQMMMTLKESGYTGHSYYVAIYENELHKSLEEQLNEMRKNVVEKNKEYCTTQKAFSDIIENLNKKELLEYLEELKRSQGNIEVNSLTLVPIKENK